MNNPIESNPSFNIEAEESKQCLVENDITTGQAVAEETSLGMDVDGNPGCIWLFRAANKCLYCMYV